MVKSISSVEEFDQLLSDNENVVVDFYGSWCTPCMKIAPHVERLEKSFPTITFVKVNVDEGTLNDLVTRYDVSSLPTFFFIKKGSIINKFKGADLHLLNQYTSLLNQ